MLGRARAAQLLAVDRAYHLAEEPRLSSVLRYPSRAWSTCERQRYMPR
jgi:hypothetical protein